MRIAIFPDNPLWSIAALAIGYLVLGGLIYIFQERLLYFPNGLSANMAGGFGLKPWPSENNFHGFISGRSSGNSRGTFLVWHGNGGAAFHRTYFTDALEGRGYRVILLEYPGYCGRPGKPGEKAIVADALAAVNLARREFPGPVYLLGESLGCGVAAEVARERSWVNGVVLVTPWSTLPDMAQSRFWYLPARWLVRDRYDNIANLAGYIGPVAVLLAENDEVVPVKFGRRLFDSLKSRKRLWVFKGANHNTWPNDPRERWWDEVVAFMSGSPP
jgi:uncharacterized protein